MAIITTQPATLSGRRFHSLKIDMTPMVDLGFLLITFFIFTATISQPRTTRLIMPAKGESTAVPASRSLTVLLDNEKAFVYEGLWEEAMAANAVTETNYDLQTGLGQRIRQKQNTLTEKDDLMVLIKPLSSASYQNIITALDEMLINDVKKYAITEAMAAEVQAVGQR
jgi:biopolymer transport protein ExbD